MVGSVVTLQKRWRGQAHVPTAVASLARRLVAPHRAALSNLASIPLTTFGLGCICTGVFYASTIAGWIVTGLALIFLEHVIADDR